MRSILDRGLQGVLVVSGRVGLQDLEGDRAALELEAFGSLGLNEAVPTAVGFLNLSVVGPVVVAQAIDGDLTVCVGHVGGDTSGAQLGVQGCVNRVEVLGGSALRRALVHLELCAIELRARICCGNLGDLHLAELGDNLGVRVIRRGNLTRVGLPTVGGLVGEQDCLVLEEAVGFHLVLNGASQVHLNLGGIVLAVFDDLLAAGLGELSGPEHGLAVGASGANQLVIGALGQSNLTVLAVDELQGDASFGQFHALVVLIDDVVEVESLNCRNVRLDGVGDRRSDGGSCLIGNGLLDASLGVLRVCVNVVDPLVQVLRVRHRNGDDEGLGADVTRGGFGLGHDVGAQGQVGEGGQTAASGGLFNCCIDTVCLSGSNVTVEANKLLPASLSGQVDVGQALNGELYAVKRGAADGVVLEASAFGGAVGGILDQLVDGDGAGLAGIQVDQ